MQIDATGPGKSGSLDEGVGSLKLTYARGREARMLQVLWQEIRQGRIGFWTNLMWNRQSGRLTKAESQVINGVADNNAEDFDQFLQGRDQ